MPRNREFCEKFKQKVVNCVINNGASKSQASRTYGVSKQLIGRWVKLFLERGTSKPQKRTGRKRKTSQREDKMICRMSIANPRLTGPQITARYNSTAEVKIGITTVNRRLRDGGLYGRRPSRKPFISIKNRRARINFAKKYASWTSKEWAKILWSDESKFNLFSSDGIQYVRRPKNKRDNIRYTVPTKKHGGGSVMVWGCFSRDMVGPLVQIEGIMDGTAYKNIIKTHMLPHAKSKMPRGWSFQQDNDPKHRSKVVKEFMKAQKVRDLDWPSQSPDLNPIEHLWEELDRAIREKKCSNKANFFATLKECWENIPIERLITLVDSMPRRCAAVIATKGYPTRY